MQLAQVAFRIFVAQHAFAQRAALRDHDIRSAFDDLAACYDLQSRDDYAAAEGVLLAFHIRSQHDDDTWLGQLENLAGFQRGGMLRNKGKQEGGECQGNRMAHHYLWAGSKATSS